MAWKKKGNVFRLKDETDGKVEFFSLFEEVQWIQNSIRQAIHIPTTMFLFLFVILPCPLLMN